MKKWSGSYAHLEGVMLLRAATFLLLLQLTYCSCPNYVSTRVSTCSIIFERLQAALVDSDVDLYNLRKTFYPTSDTHPTFINISYIILMTTAHEACPEDSSTGVEIADQLINGSFLLLNLNFAWTSKIFYTLVHPAVVNRLQPQLIQYIVYLLDTSQVATALTWDGTGPILTAEILLPIYLPCAPTVYALYESLEDLTSVMNVYADSQESISSWGDDKKGYSIAGSVVEPQWWMSIELIYPYNHIFATLNTVLTIILSLIITFVAYYAIWHIAPSAPGEKNFLFSHTFVWCGVIILLQLNVSLFFWEIVNISEWCHSPSSCKEPAGLNKMVWLMWMISYMLVSFVIMLIIFLRGKLRYMKLPVPEWRAFVVGICPLSIVSLVVVVVFHFLLKPLMKLTILQNALIHIQKILRNFLKCPRPVINILQMGMKFLFLYILCMTIFLSISILSYSLIPVMFQFFLYPFRVVSVYSFFLTAFALYALATFVATFLWKEQSPSTGRLIMYLSATTVALVFILMIAIPFIALHRLLVSGSFSSNPLVLAGASLLPSVLLSSPLVWLFRNKLLPRFLEVDEDDTKEDVKEEKNIAKVEKKKDESESKNDEGEQIEMHNPIADISGDCTPELTCKDVV